MNEYKNKNNDEPQESTFSIKNYLETCVEKWQWFALSILVICSMALLYVVRQQPQYLRMEQVLIKNEEEGGSTSAIASAFSNLGLGTNNTNVYNELITFKSPALISQVIQRLDLCNNYIKGGFPHGTTLYGSSLPFKVAFLDLTESDAASFRMEVQPDGTATFSRFRLSHAGEKPVKFDKEITLRPGFAVVRTPVGRVQFMPNPDYAGAQPSKDDEQENVRYNISHSALQPTVDRLSKKISADLADKDAEIIEITYMDDNVERANAVLETLVDIYNQNWMTDKNKMAIATSQFIDERLQSLQDELGNVDNDISEFKSRTLVPDIEEAAKLNMKSTSDLSRDILEANNQLGMAEYVKEYVNSPANSWSVIPVNTGIGSVQLENQIANYNNFLLMRNNLVASTSSNNPIVRDYDTQLKGQREAIQRGINTHVASLERAVRNLEGAKGSLRSEIASGPKQAKYLLSVERQQTVKSELYLYLLQKREENELSRKFTAENTRIITPPFGPLVPVSPKKPMIMGIAFLVSLLLPAGIIYIQEASNNKVRNRKDLDKMSTPFAGEIPFVGKKRRFEWIRKKLENKKKKARKLETVPVMVQAGNRDMMNESFRIVRSNIDFMIRNDKTQNVVMVTSFNPGSGKSFVTFNLCASFAVKGKKVLIVDCDLRHGSTSQYVGMPSKGLSNYLTGQDHDWHRMVVNVKDVPGMAVLPIGNRPPNPAELLDNGEMANLLAEATKEYDYIFMDCPPVDVVVDTQIMQQYCQHTIFVIRAGLMERSMIADIDEMYRNKRFRHMCVLLNGTEKTNSRYGTYGSAYYSSDFGK